MNKTYHALAGELLAFAVIAVFIGVGMVAAGFYEGNPCVIGFGTALVLGGVAGVVKIGIDLARPDEWL